MTTWITVCDTCKQDDWPKDGAELTDGEVFAALIETAAEGDAAIKTRRHSCLMGCTRACNVAIQGRDKVNYTLGMFEPTAAAARAVVEYATLHAQSDSGVVAFRTWPQGVKGHFVTRHPPLPDTE